MKDERRTVGRQEQPQRAEEEEENNNGVGERKKKEDESGQNDGEKGCASSSNASDSSTRLTSVSLDDAKAGRLSSLLVLSLCCWWSALIVCLLLLSDPSVPLQFRFSAGGEDNKMESEVFASERRTMRKGGGSDVGVETMVVECVRFTAGDAGKISSEMTTMMKMMGQVYDYLLLFLLLEAKVVKERI